MMQTGSQADSLYEMKVPVHEEVDMKEKTGSYEEMLDAQLKEWSAQIALLMFITKADKPRPT
jgi:hypothetical protein